MSDNLQKKEEYEKYVSEMRETQETGCSSNASPVQNFDHEASSLKLDPSSGQMVPRRDLSITILGNRIKIPIGIAPFEMAKRWHPHGECAMARACQSVGTIFTLSNLGSYTIEQIAYAAPGGLKWFQLFMHKNRAFTFNMIHRAQNAGYKALVFTIIDPIGTTTPIVSNNMLQFTIHWSDIQWLLSITNLPLIIKGILTIEEARIAIRLGVKGIWLSNNGTQVSGQPLAMNILPEMALALGSHVEIYVDGGIIAGKDIYRALALGAKMVFVGTLALKALIYNGELGVTDVLRALRDDFDFVMESTGCATLNDIKMKHPARCSKL